MTKSAKLARHRAAKLQAQKDAILRTCVVYGGTEIQAFTLSELHDEKLKVAHKLGHAIVLRPGYGERQWRVLAVKQ